MTANELRDALAARGLSVRGAADVLRVAPSQVWRLLAGRCTITDDRAALIRLRLEEHDRETS